MKVYKIPKLILWIMVGLIFYLSFLSGGVLTIPLAIIGYRIVKWAEVDKD